MNSIGIDIVEIERIESAVKRWDERFLNRIYTQAELEICQGKIASLATHFAGKEAIMKVLGTGTKDIGWREIEILPNSDGKPLVQLHGRAKERARKLNLSQFSISLSDTKQYAAAAAIGA